MSLKPVLPAETLAANFAELKPPIRPQEALVKASRCLYCFDAPCFMACPTGIDVPAFIKKIAFGNVAGAAKTIFPASILGASCAPGVLPSPPGFLATAKWIDGTHVAPFLLSLYNYAKFVGFAIAFAACVLLRKLAPNS
jgi:hypothetical protein